MAADIEPRLAPQAAGTMLPFVVRRIADGVVVGETTYCNVEAEVPRLEVGYTWTAASAQRTGVNAESKLLLLTHAFEELGCLRRRVPHALAQPPVAGGDRAAGREAGRRPAQPPAAARRLAARHGRLLDPRHRVARRPQRAALPAGPRRVLSGRFRVPFADVSDAADLPLIGAAALRARSAARVLRTLPTDAKDAALAAMADALVERTDEVLAANAADVEAAAAAGTPESVLDRLRLDAGRVAGVAAALRELVALPDPVGDVVRGSRLPNGLQLRQVRVPLGVVGIVYEARPERDRRRRRALPQERQRGAAARVGVGVRHEHRAGRRPHRGGGRRPGCRTGSSSCCRPTARRSASC